MPSYVAIQIHSLAASLPHSWAAIPQNHFSFPTLFGANTFIHIYEAISWGRLEIGKVWLRHQTHINLFLDQKYNSKDKITINNSLKLFFFLTSIKTHLCKICLDIFPRLPCINPLQHKRITLCELFELFLKANEIQ